MRFTIVLSILGLHALVAAEPSQLRLFHRLHHPQAALVPFTERGTVTFADNNPPSFQPSSSFLDDFDSFADAFQTEKIPSGQWLYQVALQRHGDNVESQWDISSVKACHLPLATSETIYLYSLDASKPIPHALDYFISPVPHDGACPPESSLIQSFPKKVNTTVVSRGASSPPVPILITPPPLSPQGEPIVPIPEKTFIQKYWMYMVAILIFTLFAGGAEEEPARKQD